MRQYRYCELCNQKNIPIGKGRQRFCGSYVRKTGCSWIMWKKYHAQASARRRKKYPNLLKEWRVKHPLYNRDWFRKKALSPTNSRTIIN